MKILSLSGTLFKAGKVHLYSDFDGTYFPAKQKDVKDGIANDKLDIYAKKMDKFFKDTEKDLDFHITTGRDFESYKEVSNLLKEKNIKLTLPESFVIENGYKEFFITNRNHEFYEQGQFPYSFNNYIKRAKGEEKSKAYNLIKILEETKNCSDLIIVAGNNGNDKEMLNPLKYIDLDKYKKASKNLDFFGKDMNGKLNDLKAIYSGKKSDYLKELCKEFKGNGLLKEIEDLPIISVIFKDSEGKIANDLLPIIETFEKTGKIIIVDFGKLDVGIRESVKKYANKSKNFRKGMSDNLKNVIYGKLNFLKKYAFWIILSTVALATSNIVFALNSKSLEQKNNLN